MREVHGATILDSLFGIPKSATEPLFLLELFEILQDLDQQTENHHMIMLPL